MCQLGLRGLNFNSKVCQHEEKCQKGSCKIYAWSQNSFECEKGRIIYY